MNYKVWLITFGVIAALVVGGAGFYAFSGYSKYSDAMQGWDDKVGTIESLERKVPYPNKDNSEALEAKVGEYEKSVDALFQSLNSFQRELNTTLLSTEFIQIVKSKVQGFRKYAGENGLEIAEASDFQLGFDLYSNVIPPQELVAILDYELEAIDHLLKSLVDCGVSDLLSFERDRIPGEDGASGDYDSGVVHKYPVRMRFSGGHNAFQDFVNKLANDKEFFYTVRVLKVRNDETEGPAKLSAAAVSRAPRFENPTTQEVAGNDQLQEWGYPDVSASELAEQARAAGFVASSQDARVLMGQENLNVFMVVDIVRFVSPEEVSANTAKEKETRGNKR
ncbi:MAG: Amuc_1100 family pilus-like protein [Verrucomicrobiales bacterium]|nr:Amuc_1100 family pilus-like protein [Verrucomicrobiales bacterium]